MNRQMGRAEAQVVTMANVYGYMCLGLIISGIMAWIFAYVPEFNNFLYTAASDGMQTLSIAGWIVLVAPLIMVLVAGFVIKDMDSGALLIFFIIFSLLMGASLSSIFLVYTEASILQCFLITGGTFGVMSLYGYSTKKDLSSWGNLLIMALIGIIIAMFVNIFLKSAMMDFIVSIIAVIVFVGLTAYDTQKIKEELGYSCDRETCKKIAIWGALSLYLDFINLLLQILKLLGKKK